MRLRREEAFLLVVDVQQKLAPHVEGHDRVISKTAALVRAARKLSIPVLISEHCPELIGATVPSLLELVGAEAVMRKTHFAGTDEPALFSRIESLKRKQAVVCGMEAHVCVMQTALGLSERAFQPFVVRDAVGSRREEDRETALDRVRGAGCEIATAEMAIFEWMGRADIPQFRELLAIVKSA
jgi:nicotinamidase-related amidase